MSDQSPLLEIKNLSKVYPGMVHPAVSGLNLTIGAGEFVTFLGPSGSGKTTTLQMISGFTSATSGTIQLNGTDILSMPTHKRGLGMVFQNYALFPHMTVYGNIEFPLRMRGVAPQEARRRALEVLGRVRMQEFGHRFPRELSGGQQQRVAIARAIVYDPPILLMDEPLGALDKRLRGELQLEIMRLHKELGMTIIFVTHDQEEALALSDRIAVFSQGRLEGIGRPEELYEKPPNLFVARFLGDSNVFKGSLRLEPYRHIECALGRIPLLDNPSSTIESGNVMIRPECIEIRDDHFPGDGHFNVNAIATAVIYEGSSRSVHFRTASGADIAIKESSRSFKDISVGAKRTLHWLARHVNWFPDSKMN